MLISIADHSTSSLNVCHRPSNEMMNFINDVSCLNSATIHWPSDVCAQNMFLYLPECLLIFQYSVQSAVIVLYFWKPFTRFRFLWDFVFEATFPPLFLWENICFRQATYDTCPCNTAEPSAVDFDYTECIQNYCGNNLVGLKTQNQPLCYWYDKSEIKFRIMCVIWLSHRSQWTICSL